MIKKFTIILMLISMLVACETKTSFAINATKEKIELDQNSSTSFTVQRKNTPTNIAIGLNVEDLPTGVSLSSSSERSIAVGKTDAVIELSASTEAQPGEYTITIKATVSDDVVEEKLLLEIFGKGGFIINLPISSLSLERGKTIPFDVEINRDISFKGSVDISLDKLPTGVSATDLRIPQGQAKGVVQLTASDLAPIGNQVVAVQGTSDGNRFETSFQLSVEQAAATPSFSLSISPQSLDIAKGKTRAVSVVVQRKGPFTGDIVISSPDAPEGINISELTIGSANSTGILNISASAATTLTADSPVSMSVTGQANANGTPLSDSATLKLTLVDSLEIDVDTSLDGFVIPWDIEFATDGTLFVTERAGATKQVKDGLVQTLSNPLDVYSPSGEPGLLGLALDPAFSSNKHMYVCYTHEKPDAVVQRVSRLTLNETALALENELVLIDDILATKGHNGCRLAFSSTGHLFVTTGDANNPSLLKEAENILIWASQDTETLAGKVLRINSDGSVPSDNPTSTDDPAFGATPNQVWAYGFRNSQGLAFHPTTGQLFATEHGDADDDEVNLIKKAKNYGWPFATGTGSENGSEPAVKAYTPTVAPAGMTFYTGLMFSEWENNALFVSLKAGQLRRLEFNANGSFKAEELLIDNDFGRLRDVAVNPVDGSIYIATSNMDGRGLPPFDNESSDKILILSQ